MRVGMNIDGTHFLTGFVAEIGLTNVTLSAANEDNIVAYVNSRYGTSFGGIAASAFDPATLALTGWWRSGGYVSGTWTGIASAGTSGGRNLVEATNPPAVAPSSIVCTVPAMAAGKYPLSVVAAAGVGTLANGVEYANPKTIPNCIWWLRPDAAVITNAAGITAWADQSGSGDSGRTATPPGVDKPPYIASDPDYTGKPTIGPFSGVGDFRLRTGIWSATFSQPYTLCVIGEAKVVGSTYFTGESGTDYNALNYTPGQLSVYAGSAGGGNAVPLAPVGLDVSKPRSFFGGIWNTTGTAFAEAFTPATAALATPATLGDVGMSVGSYFGGTSGTYGAKKITEVFAHSRGLTLREVRTLRRYRDSYYGAVA